MKALLDMVGVLLGEQRLTLTTLGRALPGPVDPKHTIKRVDRLLGNRHLHQERPLFYWVVAQLLIGSSMRPLILVDWSPADDREQHFLLRAAIPFAGRSLPIFEKIHHKAGCPRCEAYLLDAIAEILPEEATPILVSDAGFRNPWFQAVEKRGWYYVGRVRCPTCYQAPGGQEWQPVANLFPQACAEPKLIGTVQVAKSNPMTTQMVTYHRPPRGRKHRNKRGRVSQDSGSRQMARRQKEPWVLVSNLPDRSTLPSGMVKIYRMRMQIEEGFRDTKSDRYGLGFGMHRSRQGKRIEILLLIGMLANLAIMAAGLHIRNSGQQRRYQSNSVRDRNVLSAPRLGMEWLRHQYRQYLRSEIIPWPSCKSIRTSLRNEVEGQILCCV